MVAAAAVVDEEKILAEYIMNHKKTHSQTLLSMLAEIVKMTELDMKEIDAIAVSSGPGSFTGLRIGSATAKGLGFALDKPLIHVPTIEAMAYNFYSTEKLICPIMDARRGQVYTGLYSFQGSRICTRMEQTPMSVEDLTDKINTLKEPVVFLGDGVPVFRDVIRQRLKVSVEFAPPHLSRQRASSVAALGMLYYQEGKTETAAEHAPDYLRLSQAERELKEKQQNE